MGARWTETCVAPRYVDTSRDFIFISSERAAWGGGGGGVALPDILLMFSFPCTTDDHERDWPPC